MTYAIGIDQESFLSEPGGPLHVCDSSALCDWCQDEGELHVLQDPDTGDQVWLDASCAAPFARQILHRRSLDGRAPPDDRATEKAREVLRSIAAPLVAAERRRQRVNALVGTLLEIAGVPR